MTNDFFNEQKWKHNLMLRNIALIARLGLCASIIGFSSVVIGIMPSMSQPTPERQPDETPAQESLTNQSDISRPDGMKYTPEEFLRIIKQKIPGFYTNEDLSPELQRHGTKKDGMVRIDIPMGETATFPDGTRVEADGTVVKPSGVKTQPVMKNNRFTGRERIFKPDGTEMKPGETYIDSDGSVIRMPK